MSHTTEGRSCARAYLVAPPSVKSWFDHFANTATVHCVAHIGEDDEPPDQVAARILTHPRLAARVPITIYSSHFSLLRDIDIASVLESAGHVVLVQSRQCARLGLDKFAMKSFFDESRIPTPRWATIGGGDTSDLLPGPLVVKERHGTEGRGTRLLDSIPVTTDYRCYVEQFVAGDEYSVVVGRFDERWLTFPPVWKGRTRGDLVPPYKRLRMCPSPGLDPDVDLHLRELALRIADEAGLSGLMEVEYVVGRSGVDVLEINPRVSGTMRISALAAHTKIFTVDAGDAHGHLPATRAAIESPYERDVRLIDPEHEIFTTSRATIGAASYEELIAKLDGISASIGMNQQALDALYERLSPYASFERPA
jgi:carbamoylphosphate synthase large subunit